MKRRRGIVHIAIGLLLLAAALVLVLYNCAESWRAGAASDAVMAELGTAIQQRATQSAEEPLQNIADSMDQAYAEQKWVYPEMETIAVDGYDYIGILYIPSMELELPVMADWDYKRMKTAPCRYAGSVYTRDLVVCAHNYSRHFGSIERIDMGAEVYFTTVNGTVHRYIVTTREILQPTDISSMVNRESGWDLTLFTCTVSGQTRCAVRCERLADE